MEDRPPLSRYARSKKQLTLEKIICSAKGHDVRFVDNWPHFPIDVCVRCGKVIDWRMNRP